MKSWWVTLRVGDWGVQLVLLWCGALLYLAVGSDEPASYLKHLALVSVWSVLFLAAGYLINNYCDRAQDRVKATHDTRVQSNPGAVLALGIVCLIAAIAVLAAGVSHPGVLVVGGIQVIGGLAYSVPVARLKERGVWGLLVAATMQRLPGFLMIVLVFPSRPVAAVALGAWYLVLGLVFILEHQLEDLADDLKAGVRTWTSTRGRPETQRDRHLLLGVFGWVSVAAATALFVETPTATGFFSGLLLMGLSGLLAFLDRGRYIGNRSLPGRLDFSSRDHSRKIIIQGGGLSGLMAAIKLADWGFATEIHDLRPTGLQDNRDDPSVHAVRFDPAYLEDYLDCSLKGCFELVQRETLYLNGRPRRTSSPHWVCRRGRGPGTLDGHLEKLAAERGASLSRTGEPASGPTILATGLAADSFERLALKHTGLTGYWATAPWNGPNTLLTYLGEYTHPNYGYVASMDGLVYALIFSRRGVDSKTLAEFERELQETEGLAFENWRPMRGAVPRENHLFQSGHILAGTLGGMMDPFWYSGVAGALLSGGVAALSCVDPALARREHRQFTRNFRFQLLLADMADRLPWRAALIPWVVNGMVDPAGSLGRWCRAPRGRGPLDDFQTPALESEKEKVRAGG